MDLGNLITAAVINRSQIISVTHLQHLEDYLYPLSVGAVLVEFSWILYFVLNKSSKVILIIVTWLMHLMIFLTTGILFFQWLIILIILLLLETSRINNTTQKDTISSKKQILIIFLTTMFVLNPKISFGPYLGWLDSKCIVDYDLVYKGSVINRNSVRPFHFPLVQNRPNKISDIEIRSSTWGAVTSIKELRQINHECECYEKSKILTDEVSLYSPFKERLKNPLSQINIFSHHIGDTIQNNLSKGFTNEDLKSLGLRQRIFKINGFLNFDIISNQIINLK